MRPNRCVRRYNAQPFDRWHRHFVYVSTLAFLALTVTPNISWADEGGVGFWLPGLFGSLAAAP
jgi:hypothetical protein